MLSLQFPCPTLTPPPHDPITIPFPCSPCVRMVSMSHPSPHHHRHVGFNRSTSPPLGRFPCNTEAAAYPSLLLSKPKKTSKQQQQQQNPHFFCGACTNAQSAEAESEEERSERYRDKNRDEQQQQQQQQLPSGLQRKFLPQHVAVIMDGNSRWARGRGLPASAGHEAGYRTLKEIVAFSCKWGIKALTVFAFSSENWLRPRKEIDCLMVLFENVLHDNLRDFLREGIRVSIIGDLSKLPKSLQKLAKDVELRTRDNSRLDLIVAISYSGRGDIVQACQRIAQKVKEGLLEPAEVTESLIAQELETSCVTKFNYPDLLIRTSGELRLSNFLLWQSAYTELYFAKVLWPDFREADYIEALSSFQRRQRRFGQRTV